MHDTWYKIYLKCQSNVSCIMHHIKDEEKLGVSSYGGHLVYRCNIYIYHLPPNLHFSVEYLICYMIIKIYRCNVQGVPQYLTLINILRERWLVYPNSGVSLAIQHIEKKECQILWDMIPHCATKQPVILIEQAAQDWAIEKLPGSHRQLRPFNLTLKWKIFFLNCSILVRCNSHIMI